MNPDVLGKKRAISTRTSDGWNRDTQLRGMGGLQEEG